jgi:hypothetical protein
MWFRATSAGSKSGMKRRRVRIFGGHGRTKTAAVGAGEIAFVKQGFSHYIEQMASEAAGNASSI